MLGSMIVFVVAVLIVSTYMAIVHKFLKSAEDPADCAQPQKTAKKLTRQPRTAGEPQLAH